MKNKVEYEGSYTQQQDGKYLAVILKIEENNPNSDTISEYIADDLATACIWVDDELKRLRTGKGVWDE